MSAHARMLSLIRHVYGAAADETQWPTAFQCLADEYGGGVSGLQYRVGAQGTIRSARFVGLDQSTQQTILSHYATRNPWVHVTQPLFRTGDVVGLDDLLPFQKLQRTGFHHDLLRPLGLSHAFGACVFKRDHDVLSFSVVRSDRKGPYTGRELQHVRSVLPHLQRAVQVNERLSSLERARFSLSDGLDSLQHGVVVVDRRGRVVFANRAARTIVALQDGLTIAADGLIPASSKDRRRLRTLLDDSVQTGAGEGFGAGGAMTVARPSMKRPFLLLVAPMKLPLDSEGLSGMSTVFISDPEAQIESIEELVRRLYGLTTTEARVANAFAASGNLDQTADQLHLSRETVRWHLRHIYRKTGTNRQATLLKLLVQGVSRLKLESIQIVAPANHPRT